MTKVKSDLPWYARHENLSEMAYILYEVWHFDPEGLIYFLDKPWKWNAEWELLQKYFRSYGYGWDEWHESVKDAFEDEWKAMGDE